MKILQKYVYLILLTIALCAFALLGLRYTKLPITDSLRFSVSDDAGSNVVSVFDAEDGNVYVFLPSYARLDQVTVAVTSGKSISLGGTGLSNGMTCGNFALETPYSLEVNGQHKANLWFCQSKNVAAMYIDTVTGSMNSVHKDKNYEEEASVTLYTADGHISYCDERITIGGRGNSSWSLEKKSYTLSLSHSARLLDMGASAKWVLNSGGYDTSNLHNKIIYELADTVSDNSAWSPDCDFVEVYLNGEYAGLYLLCQKIDAGPDHLALREDDYFFEIMTAARAAESSAVFDLCKSHSVAVIAPANCDYSRMEALESYLNLFQEALFSADGTDCANGRAWWEYIDMDSWARKYMVEEIFANFDGGQISQFFWLDSSGQKLYAGPCWDYDLTFGEYWGTYWYTPHCLLAQRNWGGDTSWYQALCRQDVFMEQVAEIYAGEFRPLLQACLDHVIGDTAMEIESAVMSDQRRWPVLYEDVDWPTSLETMAEFLRLRILFLDALWLEKADFCIITIQTSQTYNICVPAGTVCTDLPDPGEFGCGGVWYNTGTNAPFDAAMPVTGDVTITPQSLVNGNNLALKDYITYVSIAVLGCLMLCFGVLECQRSGKEKRCAIEK